MNGHNGARRNGWIAAALVALAIPLAGTDAVAAEPLPVGEARGVRIERDRGELVVVFTRRAAALQRRLAGREATLACSDEPDEPPLGFSGRVGAEASFRLPRTHGPVRTGLRPRGSGSYDLCRLSLAPRTVRRGGARVRQPGEPIATVPLTQAGAILLDEQRRGIEAVGLLSLAGELGAQRTPAAFPTPERFLDWIERQARGSSTPVVALAAPTDTPPAGRYGYYSDGAHHAAVVTVSAAGRRLFVEVLGDGEIRTNLAWILGDLD